MEGVGVQNIMKDLKESGFQVTKVLHDKDSSTMKQVMDVFEDAEESLCLSKYHYIKLNQSITLNSYQ
jgi:hypothetical protein